MISNHPKNLSFSGLFALSKSIAVHINPRNSGTVLGFNIGVSFLGTLVFQYILGYTAEYFGSKYIIYIVLFGSLLGFMFALTLFRLMNKSCRKER